MSTKEIKRKPDSPALTKHDVVLKLNAATLLTQPDASKALQMVLDTITDCLVSGGHVEFRDFGVFEVVERKARLGRNPRKPDEIFPIPARRVIRFKMARKLTDQLSPK